VHQLNRPQRVAPEVPSAIHELKVHPLNVSAGIKQIAITQNAVEEEAILHHKRSAFQLLVRILSLCFPLSLHALHSIESGSDHLASAIVARHFGLAFFGPMEPK